MDEQLHAAQRPSSPWHADNSGTALLGEYAALLEQTDQAIRAVPQNPAARKNVTREQSLADKLFESRSVAKQLTGRIAMHLPRGWRDGFFKQVDNLLDADEWDDRDTPVLHESFQTFLRLIIFLKAEHRPGLAASANGELMAIWRKGENRLTVYCRPFDQIRWVARNALTGDDDAFETVAGETSIRRLPDFLAAFGRVSPWGLTN